MPWVLTGPISPCRSFFQATSGIRAAGGDGPVGNRWVFLTLGLPGGAQAVRADRMLHEARATGGDPRRLVDLFGLSIQHAARYTDAIAEPQAHSSQDLTSANDDR